MDHQMNATLQKPSYEALEKRVRELERAEHSRKSADDPLGISWEMYSLLMETASDIIWVFDLATMTYTFCSKSVETILGHRVEDTRGATLDMVFSGDTKQHVLEAFGKVMIGKADTTKVLLEAEHKHRDGRLIWMEINAVMQKDSSGRPLSFIGISRDISQRKQSEEESRKLASVVRHSRELVNMATPDGRMFFLNDAGKKMLGISEEEVPRTNIMSVIPAHFRDKVLQEILPSIRKNGYWEGELQYLNLKTGRLNDVYAITYSIVDPKTGELQFLANVSLDITDYKRMQAQLIQSQKMEAVGRLAGGVAHDFNNMLAVIIGRAETALMKLSPADGLYKDLLEIQSIGKRSAELTKQLLGFARRQTIAPRVINLNHAVEGMLKMLGRLIGEHIELLWKPAAELWDVKIDPAQIDQILANLMVNARDAIQGPGTIVLETANMVCDAGFCAANADVVPGEYILLAVGDNGVGLNQETLEKIFEPFFTTKPTGHGTGLGLATVYGIVKQNNGFIKVQSEPGSGTTFRIFFPRCMGPPAERCMPSPETPPAGGSETILIVEDDPSILEVAEIMLKKLGYALLTASTPTEAMRLAEKVSGEIHLIMTDVVMPEMNGPEIAERMQRLFPRIKSLYMSGYTANVIAHHGILEEGVHFIQKPFSMKELSAKVRAALA
ncbi:MAG: PAS domain S-box protein [Thermodesulfobacteriota bacterium]